MGFLSGGGGGDSRADSEIDQQITQNKAELDAKKQSLYQTRLDIIKGQGTQSFNPTITGAPAAATPAMGLGKKS